MTIDVTIAIASAGFAPKIASRAFDRPVCPADILDHKFRLMAKEAEDRAVSEIPILLFEHGKLMSDTSHRLRGRLK
jgi:hypothetical protein